MGGLGNSVWPPEMAGEVAWAATGCPLAAWGQGASWSCVEQPGTSVELEGGTPGAGGGIVPMQTLSGPAGNWG